MEVRERTAWFSIGVNSALVGLKVLLAVLSGSLAIKADAIHSLSDVFSRKGILVANWLLEQGLDQVIVNRDLSNKGSGLALTNAGTGIRVVPEKSAAKVLQEASTVR